LLSQCLLELMKVPRFEAKLRVLSFKIPFGTKVWLYNLLCYLLSDSLEENVILGSVVNGDYCADNKIQKNVKCGQFCV